VYSGSVQVLNASGNQDQPESYVNECVLFRVMLEELQRSTGVRECVEQRVTRCTKTRETKSATQ
jgi:hypothetical protein